MTEEFWANRTYYEALEVARTASETEIKKAYGFLADIWHPDRHTGRPTAFLARVTDHFQRIQVAYEILSDRAARTRYDARLAPLESEQPSYPKAVQNQPAVWKKMAKWMAHEDVGSAFQRRMVYKAGEYLERRREPSVKERPHFLAAWDLALSEGFKPTKEYIFE